MQYSMKVDVTARRYYDMIDVELVSLKSRIMAIYLVGIKQVVSVRL